MRRYDGQADGYDPSRHQIAPKVTAGKRYRKAIKEQAQAAKQEAVKPKPLEYTDINTGERNSVLSPGGMGQVIGHRLKFDPADPEQGFFFMAPDGSSSARVDVVGKNKPGELSAPGLSEFGVEALAEFGPVLPRFTRLKPLLRPSESVF